LSASDSCLRSKSGRVLQKGERRFHSNKTEIVADKKGDRGGTYLENSKTCVQTKFEVVKLLYYSFPIPQTPRLILMASCDHSNEQMPHKAWPWSAGRKCHEMGECGCMVAAL
jgi:hypothetical protein